jgi:hypothetical protein
MRAEEFKEPVMDEQTDTQPMPAVPLNYFEQHREPWMPMVQMVTRLMIALQTYALVQYFMWVGCFCWQELGPHYRYQSILGVPLVLDIPICILHLVGFLGALDARKLLEDGRRWLVASATMTLIVLPPTEIATGIFYHFAHHHYLSGPSYSVGMFTGYLLSAIGGCIFLLFIRRFYRKTEVRALFQSR